jgi:hypothetical protein
MSESHRIASIYADGFGRWTVAVKTLGPVESSGAVIIARKAIRDELIERGAHYADSRRVKVERVEYMDYIKSDTGETVVYYREGE